MNLKVLPNEYQEICDFHYKLQSKKINWRGGEFDLIEHYPNIPPVFNRVGFYMLDRTTAWYEFKMPDGSFKAIKYDVSAFKHNLKEFEADENSIPDKDWKMIQHLLRTGTLKNCDRFIDESWRRQRMDIHRQMSIQGMNMRKRVKARIEERKRNANTDTESRTNSSD